MQDLDGRDIDTFNVFGLLEVAWSYKYLILSAGILCGVIGFVFIQTSDVRYESELQISTLISGEAASLNTLKSYGILPYSEESHLLSIFVRTMQDFDLKMSVASEINIAEDSLISNDQDFLRSFASSNMHITPISEGLFIARTFGSSKEESTIILKEWTLTALEHTRNILFQAAQDSIKRLKLSDEYALKGIDEQILQDTELFRMQLSLQESRILDRIDELKEMNIISIEDEISKKQLAITRRKALIDAENYLAKIKLQLEIDKLREIYDSDKADWLKYLNEQNSIAKALQIERLQQWEGPQRDSQGSGLFSNNSQPYFFLGSIALEKEMANLVSRVDEDAFIEGMRELEADLYQLQYIDEKYEYDAEIANLNIEIESLKERMGRSEYIDEIREYEHKLKEIQNQRISDAYIPNIADLNIEKNLLINNVDIQIASDVIKDDPILSGEMLPVYVDLSSIIGISTARNPRFILVVSILIGIFLGLIFALMHRSYIRNKAI